MRNSYCLIALLALLAVAPAWGQCPGSSFDGICFPNGPLSFADSVLRYEPGYAGGNQPTSQFQAPLEALGVPDDDTSSTLSYVSLGQGGLIEVQFLDNLLTNSGDSLEDLHVFEVGNDVEDTFVAIRPADAATLAVMQSLGVDVGEVCPPGMTTCADGFYEIGKVFGATSSIDIDILFPGFLAGELKFDAVQLIDDPNEGNSSGNTVGADIDAVGAISTTSTAFPGTGEDFFLASAVNSDPLTSTPGSELKTANAGDAYHLVFRSPGASFALDPYVLLAQVFPTGSQPTSATSDIHVNPNAGGLFIILDSNNIGPFVPSGLPPSGVAVSYVLPVSASGLSVLFQPFVLSANVANMNYATADAHVIGIL